MTWSCIEGAKQVTKLKKGYGCFIEHKIKLKLAYLNTCSIIKETHNSLSLLRDVKGTEIFFFSLSDDLLRLV